HPADRSPVPQRDDHQRRRGPDRGRAAPGSSRVRDPPLPHAPLPKEPRPLAEPPVWVEEVRRDSSARGGIRLMITIQTGPVGLTVFILLIMTIGVFLYQVITALRARRRQHERVHEAKALTALIARV